MVRVRVRVRAGIEVAIGLLPRVPNMFGPLRVREGHLAGPSTRCLAASDAWRGLVAASPSSSGGGGYTCFIFPW